MPDPSSILWPAEPHTLAKHAILEKYAKAWTAILSKESAKHPQREEELLFVDGFAGPGAYKSGEPGSPILAIKLLVEHTQDFPTPVHLLFIENDPDSCEHLNSSVKQWDERIRGCQRISKVEVIAGDCADVLHRHIDRLEKRGRALGPAFFFLDQFGWSQVPLDLIARIMGYRACEVLSFMNWSRLNQFMSDRTKWDTISSVFGGDEWKAATEQPQQGRRETILKAYKHALHSRARSEFVWDFAMRDTKGRTYWLFFCTNSLRGLEVMKTAMWQVDPSGGFCFSDKDDPAQLVLFSQYDARMLARDMSGALKGETLSVDRVRRWTLTETPEYRHKPALKLLEREGRLQVVNAPAGRRKGSFADKNMLVRFTGELD